MRVCIICRENPTGKGKFSISSLAFFRGTEIFRAEIFGKPSARRVKKCLKALAALKISFAVFRNGLDFSALAESFGISAVDGERAYSFHIAEMALLLAEKFNFPKKFRICGGSFFSVTRIALRLLVETGDVFVSCADSDAVCEAVYDACGASLRTVADDPCIEIFPSRSDAFLVCCDKSFSYADFSLRLPDELSERIPESLRTAAASLLEICGTISHTELTADIL